MIISSQLLKLQNRQSEVLRVLSLWNLHHLPTVLVVLIACAVMLWVVLREADIIELNINVDSHFPLSSLNSAVDLGANKLLFKLIWRGAKGIPADWDIALVNAVVGRVHPPFTAELLGRKVTIIVDGRDDVMERVVSSGIDLPLYDADGSIDYGSGFTKIKIVLLTRNLNLPQAVPLRDVYTEHRHEA